MSRSLARKSGVPVQRLYFFTHTYARGLELIAKGCTNKVIARQLDISEGTVKGHVKHILKKLGCRSRVEAAVWAAQQKEAH